MVDLPILQLRADGNGTTMTGPLLRRIFSDHPELLADTTGIPLQVIKNTWTLYMAGVSRKPGDVMVGSGIPCSNFYEDTCIIPNRKQQHDCCREAAL